MTAPTPLTDAALAQFEALDTETALLLLTRLAYSRADVLGDAVHSAAVRLLQDAGEPEHVIDNLFPGTIYDATERARHNAEIAARIEFGLAGAARFADEPMRRAA